MEASDRPPENREARNTLVPSKKGVRGKLDILENAIRRRPARWAERTSNASRPAVRTMADLRPSDAGEDLVEADATFVLRLVNDGTSSLAGGDPRWPRHSIPRSSTLPARQ